MGNLHAKKDMNRFAKTVKNAEKKCKRIVQNGEKIAKRHMKRSAKTFRKIAKNAAVNVKTTDKKNVKTDKSAATIAKAHKLLPSIKKNPLNCGLFTKISKVNITPSTRGG
jgi:hypothetical protein